MATLPPTRFVRKNVDSRRSIRDACVHCAGVVDCHADLEAWCGGQFRGTGTVRTNRIVRVLPAGPGF